MDVRSNRHPQNIAAARFLPSNAVLHGFNAMVVVATVLLFAHASGNAPQF